MIRPRRFLPILLVATAAWLAAGPGGVTLQAIAACWHHPPARGAQHGHDAGPPPGTPCFCDQMAGGSHVLVSPELPTPAAVPDLRAVVGQEVPFPLPDSPFPGFSPTPVPPPPNPLA